MSTFDPDALECLAAIVEEDGFSPKAHLARCSGHAWARAAGECGGV